MHDYNRSGFNVFFQNKINLPTSNKDRVNRNKYILNTDQYFVYQVYGDLRPSKLGQSPLNFNLYI